MAPYSSSIGWEASGTAVFLYMTACSKRNYSTKTGGSVFRIVGLDFFSFVLFSCVQYQVLVSNGLEFDMDA